MSKLRALAKSCNFGDYLKIALRDQFVRGLKDSKYLQELLSIVDLTLESAQSKAQTTEVVTLETKSMKDPGIEDFRMQGNMHAVCVTCY